MSAAIELYVSPAGDDTWSGTRATPARAGGDGPVATLPRALQLARQARRQDTERQVRIRLRGGVYRLDEPVRLGPEDSGSGPRKVRGNARVGAEQPLVIAAYEQETPVLSGAVEVTGFTETTHEGRRAWVVDLPEVAAGRLSFRQLFVDGQRRQRPRWPRDRFAAIERLAPGPEADSWKRGTNDRFHYVDGDIDPSWRNLTDVEVVLLHVWIESRMWITGVDPEQRLVTLDRFSTSGMSAQDPQHGSAYFCENVAEALSEPGQWYLDRPTGRLTYLPLPGESLRDAVIEVPVLPHLLQIEGSGEQEPVQYVSFEGIGFAHTEWTYAAPESGCEQAARAVPAAIQVTDAQRIRFTGCDIGPCGNWGIEFLGSSRDNRVDHCILHDLGGGGVKAWHGTNRTTVTDCEIAGCGRVFYSSVGVLVGNSGGNRILHNEIHDVRYTGVSLGWHWGYEQTGNQGNIVEHNHIHDIGAGYLSDMGGIYCLGPQQGSRLRHNHIHDVKSRTYGGWGIYPDEGCSDLLVEFNLVHDCNRACFHQHYGRDNEIRNNIFAFGGDAQIQLSCPEAHTSYRFHHNIVLFDTGVLWMKGASPLAEAGVEVDHNLYCDLRGRRLDFGGMSWTAWRKLGRDRHSLNADPRFDNAAQRRFRLKKTSPAWKLGFLPFDVSDAGPRR